jgi:ABC-type transport system substrate-binding protein
MQLSELNLRITALSILVLGFFGPGSNAVAQAQEPRGQIRIVESWRPDVNVLGYNVLQYLYKYALDRDELVPCLAVSRRWVNDTILELKLRKGVRFHNGEPFDAEPRGEIRVVESWRPDINVLGHNVLQYLFEYALDKNELSPSLAVSREWIDEITLELKLRQGVRFHNAEPFDARALKLNFDYQRRHNPTRGIQYYMKNLRVRLRTTDSLRKETYTQRWWQIPTTGKGGIQRYDELALSNLPPRWL